MNPQLLYIIPYCDRLRDVIADHSAHHPGKAEHIAAALAGLLVGVARASGNLRMVGHLVSLNHHDFAAHEWRELLTGLRDVLESQQ